MADQKSIKELGKEADLLATSFEYINHGGVIYAPMDYLTGDMSCIPDVDRKIWVPVTTDSIVAIARSQFNTQFTTPKQTEGFLYMVQQACQVVSQPCPLIMVRTSAGLKVLEVDGTLVNPVGQFIPNTINWTLNEDPDDQAEMAAIILEWVGGDAEVYTSLMHHLATALAPHWSSGKYVLLIGEGRNGKSVLLTMLRKLFGAENCSGVTRQQISAEPKVVPDLRGKLLNVVMDGPLEFVKDSGREKSLVTGEMVSIPRLYFNSTLPVQTNALFIEGLNHEPKSRDKSGALQARLVRFQFPNRFADDLDFFHRMMSERMLGALLALLIQHYVKPAEISVKLAPTKASQDMQVEHMVTNSLALQFILYMEQVSSHGAEELLTGMWMSDLASKFKSWRISENDIGVWADTDLYRMFKQDLVLERRSRRVGTKVIKEYRIEGLENTALAAINTMKEEEDAGSLVDDGHV